MISSYDDLSVRQYDAIVGVLNSESSDSDKDLQILGILADTDADVIAALDVDEVNGMLEKAKFLLVECKGAELSGRDIEWCGKRWKPYDSVEKMTWAQWMDTQKADTMEGLVRCLMVPCGAKYNDGSYEDIDWGSMKYTIGKGVVDFFMDGVVVSTRHTLRSLRRRLSVLRRVKRRSCEELQVVETLVKDTEVLLSSIR